MGFTKVYQLLRQEFDWIDAHLLKAVAIKHPHDPDQAFCFVLDNIIPNESSLKRPDSVVPGVSVTTNGTVRSIPITTPSPQGTVSTEQTIVSQKQPVETASEVTYSVAGPSRTFTNSKKSNHSATDEYAGGNNGMKLEGKIVPKENKIAPEVNAPESQADHCGLDYFVDLVKDVESDKKNLISALESVLNTLKEVEAKKQEALLPKDILVEIGSDVVKNSSSLTDEVKAIKSRLLKLSNDMKKSMNVINEMDCILREQLAQLEEAINKENEQMKLQKQAQMNKEARLLKLAAKDKLEQQELFKELHNEVDDLQSVLENISNSILLVKDEIDKEIQLRQFNINHSKRCTEWNLSRSSRENEDSKIVYDASSYKLPSVKNYVYDSPFSSEESEDSSEDSDQESEDSEYETETESTERVAPSVTPPNSSSTWSLDQKSEETESSEPVALSVTQPEASSAVAPDKIITNYVQEVPSKTVSNATSLPHMAVHHEAAPHKSSSPVITNVAAKSNSEATSASNNAKVPSEDGWDFCE